MPSSVQSEGKKSYDFSKLTDAEFLEIIDSLPSPSALDLPELGTNLDFPDLGSLNPTTEHQQVEEMPSIAPDEQSSTSDGKKRKVEGDENNQPNKLVRTGSLQAWLEAWAKE